MKKITVVLMMLTIMLSTCSVNIFDEITYPYLKIYQNDASFNDLVFYNAHNVESTTTSTFGIFGVDKETYEVKVKIGFGTFVTIGTVTPKGRLIVTDDGPKMGSAGIGIFVINDDGTMYKKINGQTIGQNLVVYADGRVYVNNSDTTTLAVYDSKTFDPILIDTNNILKTSISIGNGIKKNSQYIFFPNYGYGADSLVNQTVDPVEHRANMVIMNSKTMEWRRSYNFNSDPAGGCQFAIDESKILVSHIWSNKV